MSTKKLRKNCYFDVCLKQLQLKERQYLKIGGRYFRRIYFCDFTPNCKIEYHDILLLETN